VLRLSTAYLLTCAAIGVATGLLIIPATAASTLLSPVAPPLAALTYAAWVIGYVVAMRLIERPGAAVLTGLISGIVAAPLSATGPAIIVTNVMFAFFVELPFLVVLYRRWSTWLYFAGTTLAAALYAVWSAFSVDMAAFPGWVVGLYLALTVVSAPAGAWLGLVVADALARTGVARLARRRPTRDAADAAGTPAA
jgi:energy-coupling factor transport system permease protein